MLINAKKRPSVSAAGALFSVDQTPKHNMTASQVLFCSRLLAHPPGLPQLPPSLNCPSAKPFDHRSRGCPSPGGGVTGIWSRRRRRDRRGIPKNEILKLRYRKAGLAQKWFFFSPNSKIVWECEAPVFKKPAVRYYLGNPPHHPNTKPTRDAVPHKHVI